uniref:Peptidase S33 tripeptidyl aminopeptidase-like C-terminal domain-containing protein n=1 Tax=Mycena chlorophos TaxID=658473 RepID=A0ABQ0KZI6_MYCCL|nr:predicted protein [Mycena chlorophos]
MVLSFPTLSRPRRPYAYTYYGDRPTWTRVLATGCAWTFPFSRLSSLIIATFVLSLTAILLTLGLYSGWGPVSPTDSGWSGPVYDPFTRPSAAEAIANTTIRPILAHSRIPDACLDEWVAHGRWRGPCIRVPLEESQIDLVYNWVNGSDPYHAQARTELLAAMNYTTRDARFRQHDELRYSLRSAFKNLKPWRNSVWHVITADVPDPAAPPEDAEFERIGLVPQWMDIDEAWAGGANGEPPVYLYHDSQIFRMTAQPGRTPSIQEVEQWRSTVLPTFNSMAVESQIAHLDPEIVSENILYLNDDQFFLLPLPPSAFHTPLYGPVLRFDAGFTVAGDDTGDADGGGEWRSLGWTAHLLNQRFGGRGRAYVEHNPRPFSLPLLHETALAFGKAFADTPRSQFRGSHTTDGEYEVNTIFAATHYVIERHREALLWSWAVAKWGGEDGVLGPDLKDAMWLELTDEDEDVDEFRRNVTERMSNRDVELNLRAARLEQPQSSRPTERANSTYLFVSLDGYTPNHIDRPHEVLLSRSECIGVSEERAWDLFRRLAVEIPHCGDAVISALTDSSPHGLEIFLPPPTSHQPVPDPAVLPLLMPPNPPPLPSNPRGFAVRLIHRYAYTIGHVPSHFFGVTTAKEARDWFSWLDTDLAMLGVNDDLYDDPVNLTQGDRALRELFQKRWPVPLDYELSSLQYLERETRLRVQTRMKRDELCLVPTVVLPNLQTRNRPTQQSLMTLKPQAGRCKTRRHTSPTVAGPNFVFRRFKYGAHAASTLRRRHTSAVRPVITFVFLSVSGCLAQTDFDWSSIKPSANLKWTSCYGEGFDCARLLVPLDYASPKNSKTAAIAMTRLRSTSSSSTYRGPLLINPGGPGGSGVEYVLELGSEIAGVVGAEYDIVGVSFSTPSVSWFVDDAERAMWYPPNSNTMYPSLNETALVLPYTYARSQVQSQLAAARNADFLQFITTDYTAQDMLTITEAFGFEKLQYWGISYGSVLGATFAALFPEKIGSVVIDGVFPIDKWYSANTNTLVDTDKVLDAFFTSCFEVGPSLCAFHNNASSASDIAAAYDNLLSSIQQTPVPALVSLTQGNAGYGVVDYALVKNFVFHSLYAPYNFFPGLAQGLADLAAGNSTTIYANSGEGEFTCGGAPLDRSYESATSIACSDMTPNDTLADLQSFYAGEEALSQFADLWVSWRVACAGWKIRRPGRYMGPTGPTKTNAPMLVIGNTFDPVTPWPGASETANALFPGSGLLTYNTPGHTSFAGPSTCVDTYISAYFRNGTLPPAGTVCQPDAHMQLFSPNGTSGPLPRDLGVTRKVAKNASGKSKLPFALRM